MAAPAHFPPPSSIPANSRAVASIARRSGLDAPKVRPRIGVQDKHKATVTTIPAARMRRRHPQPSTPGTSPKSLAAPRAPRDERCDPAENDRLPAPFIRPPGPVTFLTETMTSVPERYLNSD